VGDNPLLGKEAPLNRKELVDAIQKHTEVARADVDKVLASLIQHTQIAVKKGDRVSLVGFGTFERRDRKARTARNPRTGDAVKVKATKIPAFRAGQGFKDVVSGRAAAPKLTAPKASSRSNGTKASKASAVKAASRATAKPAKATKATAKPAKATKAKATAAKATAAKATAAKATKAKATAAASKSRSTSSTKAPAKAGSRKK